MKGAVILMGICASISLVSANAFAQSCQPDFQVKRSKCVKTGEFESKGSKSVTENIHDGFDGNPDEAQMCRNYVKVRSNVPDGVRNFYEDYRDAVRGSARVERAHTENDSEGSIGRFEISNGRVDVLCDISYEESVEVKVSASSCPANGAVDKNDCLGKKIAAASAFPISMDDELTTLLNNCLGRRPAYLGQTVAEVVEQTYIKAQCLLDFYKAINEFSVAATRYDEVRWQLEALAASDEDATSGVRKLIFRRAPELQQ